MESMTLERKPAPGAPEAVNLGCSCPKHENRGGAGVAHLHEGDDAHDLATPPKYFCVRQDCPVHGFRS